MMRRILLALVPLTLGCFATAAWYAVGETRVISFRVDMASMPIWLGLAISAIALIRVACKRARIKGHTEENRQHREEHRQFLQRLDHELKNPLTAIRTAAALGGEDSARTIVTQSERMSRLLTDLRKLADLETAPLTFEDVDVEEAVRDAVDAITQEFAAQGRTKSFSMSFPEAPWPLSHVTGDGDLLYSALHNLISNAAKYSSDDAVIEIRASEAPGVVRIEVADTGIGIPPEDMKNIWEELSRGSNAHALPGHGLGLALVSTIVARHNGTCSVSSRLGVGTSMTISLPRRDS